MLASSSRARTTGGGPPGPDGCVAAPFVGGGADVLQQPDHQGGDQGLLAGGGAHVERVGRPAERRGVEVGVTVVSRPAPSGSRPGRPTPSTRSRSAPVRPWRRCLRGGRRPRGPRDGSDARMFRAGRAWRRSTHERTVPIDAPSWAAASMRGASRAPARSCQWWSPPKAVPAPGTNRLVATSAPAMRRAPSQVPQTAAVTTGWPWCPAVRDRSGGIEDQAPADRRARPGRGPEDVRLRRRRHDRTGCAQHVGDEQRRRLARPRWTYDEHRLLWCGEVPSVASCPR